MNSIFYNYLEDFMINFMDNNYDIDFKEWCPSKGCLDNIIEAFLENGFIEGTKEELEFINFNIEEYIERILGR